MSDPTDPNYALEVFVSGENALLLPTLVRSKMAAKTRRLAPDLAGVGLVDDVVSHAFELILKPAARKFDPCRGTAWTYLIGFLFRSIEDVRSEAGAAGVSKHDRRRYLSADGQIEVDRGRAPQKLTVRSRPHSISDAKADEICEKIDMEVALASLEDDIRSAAQLIRLSGLNMSRAAQVVGVDRNTLQRRLRDWAIAARLVE